METRANYVLIGAFTLAGFAGLLGFLLWFAQTELDRQFAYYEVRFSSVSGLSRASDVRFAGLPVGQVADVRLAPDGDGTVLVRLEIGRDVPVRTDSIATIESQGVTGVSYVGISPGNRASPRLTAEDGLPEIEAGRSVLQSLSEDAPEIVTEVLRIAQQIGEIVNDDNLSRMQRILNNLESSSENLGQALDDFAVVTSTVATASTDIAAFTIQLDPIVEGVEATLDTVNTTLNSVTALAGRIEISLDEGDAALRSGRAALDAAELFMTGDLPVIVEELTTTTASLRGQIDTLGAGAQEMIAGFTATGAAATARLTEAQETIAATERAIDRLTGALDSVDAAAVSFDTLMSGDAAYFFAEARELVSGAEGAISALNRVAEADLPAIVADIRAATASASRTVTEVGENLSSATGRIDGIADSAVAALDQAADTFARANDTMAAIDSALTVGERTLEAAERTFVGADRVINEDVGAITADLRAAMARLDGAIARVSDDIPAITADLRAAAGTAQEAFAELGGMVAASGAPVRDFAANGLPQFTRLARETRGLIDSLDRIARQIERDPARFLLNRQSPEFRR
ncbi:MAG: MlaD family protein [Gemmobacter sp.]